MPYVIRDEGLVLQGDDGKEPIFHTYEEAEKTLKTLTIPQFPKQTIYTKNNKDSRF
ncbi:hypothetical protein [Bacillus cereus]|uniref:hypothetical protein n=1 Tax=Bacillus cereus TaxID=1396 RepID=UPI00159BCA57|nr:hypothetical protein [Bacillus cereus]